MSEQRHGTCGACGCQFPARAKGKVPRHCPNCEPNRGNRNRRKRLIRTEAQGPAAPSTVVQPGVGGPNEARAREAMQAVLVAAHLRAAAGCHERAAQMAGLIPEAMDMDAVAAEIEEHHQDLVDGRVEGLLRVSAMFSSAVLARLTTSVLDMPIGQLGSSLKAALEACERLQEQFGAAHSGIQLRLTERDKDVV